MMVRDRRRLLLTWHTMSPSPTMCSGTSIELAAWMQIVRGHHSFGQEVKPIRWSFPFSMGANDKSVSGQRHNHVYQIRVSGADTGQQCGSKVIANATITAASKNSDNLICADITIADGISCSIRE
jgi:hypothetical protein